MSSLQDGLDTVMGRGWMEGMQRIRTCIAGLDYMEEGRTANGRKDGRKQASKLARQQESNESTKEGEGKKGKWKER